MPVTGRDPPLELEALQHWMQGLILAEGAMERRLAAGQEAHGIDASSAVIGSRLLPPEHRLAIYARGYLLRLLECLRAEFPALRLLVGEQVFDLFAHAYLQTRPPTSYTLYDLGNGFTQFLEMTRPPDTRRGSLEALPASLARLERARSLVHRARGVEGLAGRHRFTPSALLLTPSTCLRTPDSAQFLCMDFDFAPTLAAADLGESPPLPRAQDLAVAVARSHYRVCVHSLEPARFAWLKALGPSGNTVQAAVAEAARATGREASEILADVVVWLPFAVQAGLVTTDCDDSGLSLTGSAEVSAASAEPSDPRQA